MLEEKIVFSESPEHTETFNLITEHNFEDLTDHEIELVMDELSQILRNRRRNTLRDENGQIIVSVEDCQPDIVTAHADESGNVVYEEKL